MVVAVRAAAAVRQLEVGFWLLHVELAFAVPENLMHSTSEYEVDWLGLVRARWFGLHEHNSRG